MSVGLEQILYLAALLLIIRAALLGIAARGQSRATPRARGLCAIGALVICFLPISGLPLWRWVIAVWANPSVPLVAIAIATMLRHDFGVDVLPASPRRALWRLGAIVGTALYFHAYVFGGLDLYFWGWDGRVFTLGLTLAALGALAGGCRSGVVLLLALVAWALGPFESPNGWDYVVDPVYWLASLVAVGRSAMRGRGNVPAPAS